MISSWKTPEPDDMELEAIRYLDEVLQREDIDIVESVQRGMQTPAFTQGRIVNDPSGSENPNMPCTISTDWCWMHMQRPHVEGAGGGPPSFIGDSRSARPFPLRLSVIG